MDLGLFIAVINVPCCRIYSLQKRRDQLPKAIVAEIAMFSIARFCSGVPAGRGGMGTLGGSGGYRAASTARQSAGSRRERRLARSSSAMTLSPRPSRSSCDDPSEHWGEGPRRMRV